MPVTNSVVVELNGQAVPIVLFDPEPADVVHLDVPPKIPVRAAGKCIYFGSTSALQDEHVVPYGLSGDFVIPKASCASCARETGRCEQLVLRGPMRAARIYRKLKSRTQHGGSSDTQRIVIVRDSGEVAVDVPLAEYPILLNFPIFAQPGCLSGVHSPGIQLHGIHTVLFGPLPEEVAKSLGARALRFPVAKEQPTAFARMIAKSAYGFAFAGGYVDRIEGVSPVIPSIIGQIDNIGQWVCSDQGKTVTYPGFLHRVVIREIGLHLVAEVHLFADSQTPKYRVMLGRLR